MQVQLKDLREQFKAQEAQMKELTRKINRLESENKELEKLKTDQDSVLNSQQFVEIEKYELELEDLKNNYVTLLDYEKVSPYDSVYGMI